MSEKIDLLNMCSLLAPGLEDMLAPRFHVHRADGTELTAAARQARVLIPGGGGVNAALMDQLPNLEIISLVGVGYDRVDIAHAATRGIVVTNTPDVLTDDVADLAIALMLMVSRRLAVADRLVRAGGWKIKDPVFGASPTGKTMGIVGLGRIGSAIAARAQAMDMKIAYTKRRKTDTSHRFVSDLVTLARESDFLVLAASAGPDTHHMINRTVLEALGPSGIFINIARGAMVDEAALVDLLQKERLAGAGLDVFEHEPQVPQALRTLDTVVLAPHVGSATVETRTAMARLAVQNIIAHCDGKPLPSEVPESQAARKRA